MLSITCGQLPPLEIDLDESEYVKIEQISKATQLPLNEFTLSLLLEYTKRVKEALKTGNVENYAAFEQKLQKLERDVKAAIPAHSLVSFVSHVPHMVCEGIEQSFYLDAYRIALKRRGRGGYKQGHFVIWADDAKDEEGSPDAGRETSEEQGGIKRCP